MPSAPAKSLNILDGIDFLMTGRAGSSSANSDEFLHRFHAFVPAAEVAFANDLPHEFRNGCLSAPCVSVQRIPKIFVEV